MEKILNSYAKINLFLEIQDKRPDNFHDLRTLFCQISLHDKISILHSEKLEIITEKYNIPDEDNILHKVIKKLTIYQKTDNPEKLKITIEKNIPPGSGLGGASSNAAIILKTLNELLGISLSDNRLTEIASEIGADCAFFINGGIAVGEGAGEILTPVNTMLSFPVVVVFPDVHLSTAKMYGILDEMRQSGDILYDKRFAHEKFHNLMTGILKGDIYEVSNNLYNDFDKVAVMIEPMINQVKQLLLDNGALCSMLTGSGSAVFGIFESNNKANYAKENIIRYFPETFFANPQY